MGDFSREWKCLGGFKYLYVNSKGGVQWCAQQRAKMTPLETMGLKELRDNNHHKPCEAGCSLGCVRMVSLTLGEPLSTLGASLKLATGIGAKPKKRAPALKKEPAPPVPASRA